MQYIALIYADEEAWSTFSEEQRQAAYEQYRAFGREAGAAGHRHGHGPGGGSACQKQRDRATAGARRRFGVGDPFGTAGKRHREQEHRRGVGEVAVEIAEGDP